MYRFAKQGPYLVFFLRVPTWYHLTFTVICFCAPKGEPISPPYQIHLHAQFLIFEFGGASVIPFSAALL